MLTARLGWLLLLLQVWCAQVLATRGAVSLLLLLLHAGWVTWEAWWRQAWLFECCPRPRLQRLPGRWCPTGVVGLTARRHQLACRIQGQ